jgi:gelsolin
LSYFKDGIKIMTGGIESGFNKVGPKEYKTKLMHIKGTKARVQVFEVAPSVDSLNDGDAFVLDSGLKLYTWMGENAAGSEKFKATQVANDLKNSRKGCSVERLETEGSDEFWKLLGGKGTIKTKDEGDAMEVQAQRKPVLFKLSDDKDGDGKMEFDKVAEGELKLNMLKSDDVFIADVGDSCIVWVGKGASKNESKNALPMANKYLGLNERPAWLPIIRVMEGDEGALFGKVFN